MCSLKMSAIPVYFSAMYALVEVFLCRKYILRHKSLHIFLFYRSSCIITKGASGECLFHLKRILFIDSEKLLLQSICPQENDRYRKWMFKKIVILCDNNTILTLSNAKKSYRSYFISIKSIITQKAEPLCNSSKHFINCEFWFRFHDKIQKK